MIPNLIHNIPVLFGVTLIALSLGGRIPLITGIVLVILGLYFK